MKTARIYVFGDSLTYGAWDSQGGWCDRLKRKFHQLKLNSSNTIKFQIFNLGIGGENSKSLLKRFKAEIDSRHRSDWPAVIIIATGANETRYTNGGQPSIPIKEYHQNLVALINIAQEYTHKILLVGIAPVKNDIQPFKNTLLSNQLLNNYDKAITEVAAKKSIPKVDVFNELKSINQPIFSTDGVHPNDTGHEIIQNLVWTKLEKILFE